jgi:hypothetical protein
MCFTSENDLFSWGSNKFGQLGFRLNETVSLGNGAGPGLYLPKKINTKVFSPGGTRFAIEQVAVSVFNSLVVVRSQSTLHSTSFAFVSNIRGHERDREKSSHRGEVFQCGHGSHCLTKVQFAHNVQKRAARKSVDLQQQQQDANSASSCIASSSSSSSSSSPFDHWGSGGSYNSPSVDSPSPPSLKLKKQSSISALAQAIKEGNVESNLFHVFKRDIDITMASAGLYHNCAISSAGS